MTGAFFNAIGILFGALFGLARCAPLSASMQDFFRRALGVATIFFGLRLVWLGANGTFGSCVKQILIALIAIFLGNLTGKILRLQKISNRLGRFAGGLISAPSSHASRKIGDGFIACTILFCAAPLGLVGAVTDGLSGDFYLLAVKAVMDALAMAGFMKIFGWPAALSAFPVYLFLGAITLSCQFCAKHYLDARHLIDPINITGGLIACVIALVIFQVRKIELANYLPALVVAPFLARLIG